MGITSSTYFLNSQNEQLTVSSLSAYKIIIEFVEKREMGSGIDTMLYGYLQCVLKQSQLMVFSPIPKPVPLCYKLFSHTRKLLISQETVVVQRFRCDGQKLNYIACMQ